MAERIVKSGEDEFGKDLTNAMAGLPASLQGTDRNVGALIGVAQQLAGAVRRHDQVTGQQGADIQMILAMLRGMGTSGRPAMQSPIPRR